LGGSNLFQYLPEIKNIPDFEVHNPVKSVGFLSYQNGGHSHFFCGLEVGGEVFDHHALLSVYTQKLKDLVVGFRVRFGDEMSKGDVKNPGKVLFHSQAPENPLRMWTVAAGENTFILRDGFQKAGQGRIGRELFFDSHVVNIFEEGIYIEVMVDHQPPHG
jgi:hypothetical protein